MASSPILLPPPECVPGVDALVAQLCSRLESGLQPGEERVRAALSQLVNELAFDEAVLIAKPAVPDDRLPIRIAASESANAQFQDLAGQPWIDSAINQSGALVWSSLSDSSSDIPPEAERQLVATGLRFLLCVPMRPRDPRMGALMLGSRHVPPGGNPASLRALETFAEAAGRVLQEGKGRDDRTVQPSWSPFKAPMRSDQASSPERVAAVARTRLPERMTASDADDGIVGESAAWRYVMFRVDQVASTHATVLLLGETGTGKELIARAIHRRSPRGHGRFVAINCAALPATLIESELFGRERGAFTGAHTSQAGRFELAHRGTLFLDEVADLPLELQPKLLRVLQEGQIDRLGGSRTVDVDVRVIAATNRDLGEDVRQGRFRCDLFYRLNVFPITLPSLRERRDDIPLLVRHLADRFAKTLRKPIERIPAHVMRLVQEHDWPGNIRELENVIQRAIILSTNGTLAPEDICLPSGQSVTPAATTTLEHVEREHILRTLASTSWRIEGARGAAQLLGLRPSTLRSRLKKLGVRRDF